jgi:hypothetical protein
VFYRKTAKKVQKTASELLQQVLIAFDEIKSMPSILQFVSLQS